MSKQGDNVGRDQLRVFFERIERMHEERRAIGDDIKEIFAEAKATGFDVKAMKIVLQKRRMDTSERQEQEALVDLYMSALGMIEPEPAPRARARARENIEEFAAGEAEDNADEQVAQPVESGPVDARASIPQPAGQQIAPLVRSSKPASPAGAEGDEDRPTLSDAAKNALRLRPHCLAAQRDELTKCGGHGKVHCHTCLKAFADAEGMAA